MTPTNETRAERAENALRAYAEAKGEVFENSCTEIADLIADLLHLIERDHTPNEEAPWINDVIRATLDLAEIHFEAERSGDDDS